MDIPEGLELSAKKVEYLKYLFGRGGFVKTSNLASQFGVDPSTITKTITELADSGYINHTPYHGVCLSEKGSAVCGILHKKTPGPCTHADPLRNFP